MVKRRTRHRPFENPEVAAVFDAYPRRVRTKLMALRRIIFDTASTLEGVGELEEALRWGEPSYLTSQTKSGSMIRLDSKAPETGEYAMYFHCATDLISGFRAMFPDDFSYDGKRAIIFAQADDVPVDELSHCVASALTYHLNKKRGRSGR